MANSASLGVIFSGQIFLLLTLNSKVVIFIFSGLISFCSCGKSSKKELKSNSDSTKTQIIDSTTDLNDKVIDSLIINLDEDPKMEKISIIGIHSDINYKFQIYDDSGVLIGNLFSNNQYPWLDSLEKTVGDCKILWGNEYLNGSDCGGDAYYGYGTDFGLTDVKDIKCKVWSNQAECTFCCSDSDFYCVDLLKRDGEKWKVVMPKDGGCRGPYSDDSTLFYVFWFRTPT